jgi:hypothetical protein
VAKRAVAKKIKRPSGVEKDFGDLMLCILDRLPKGERVREDSLVRQIDALLEIMGDPAGALKALKDPRLKWTLDPVPGKPGEWEIFMWRAEDDAK